MNRRLLLIAMAAGLASPFIYNAITYSAWNHGFVAESTIFSIDKARYFSDLIDGKSLFYAGQYTVFPLTYFLWYGAWSTLDLILPNAASYFMLITTLFIVAFYCLTTLLLELGSIPMRHAKFPQLFIAALCSFAFYSSVSSFNYIKSNIIFELPYLLLPALLLFACRFMRTSSTASLLIYFLLTLGLTDLNLTHAIILLVFTNIALVLVSLNNHLPASQALKRALIVNVVTLPAILFLLGVVVGNAIYPGSLSSFAAVASENMYSNNASYINVFAQMTDWGIFGSWNGSPYYAFSAFYSNHKLWVFALCPFMLLGYALMTAGRRISRVALMLLLVMLSIFQLMLGNNNIIYHYLYEHIAAFQVFRNITKFAPLLYLTLILATFITLKKRVLLKRPFYITTTLLTLTILYNLPFWLYAGYFFQDRTVKEVPHYWREAAAFLERRLRPNSKILTLPAIYISDIYNWNGKQNWLQGNLLDVLLRNDQHSYRLSECCIGSLRFQNDARATFVPSAYSLRQLDIDYRKLSALTRAYHLDYVVLSTDLVSEYQQTADILTWLRGDSYREVAEFGPVLVFEKPSNWAPLFSPQDVSFSRISNLEYRLKVNHLKGVQDITFREAYHSGWNIFVEPYADDTPRWGIDGMRHLERIPDFAWTHTFRDGDSNLWTLDEPFIRKHFTKSFYRLNPDGSINLVLGLYFRPELVITLLLAGSLAASFFTGVVLLSILLFYQGRRERMLTSIIVAASVSALALAGHSALAKPATIIGGVHFTGAPQALAGTMSPLRNPVIFRSPIQKPLISQLAVRPLSNAAPGPVHVSGCGTTAEVQSIGLRNRPALFIRPLSPGICSVNLSASPIGMQKAHFAGYQHINVMGALSWSAIGYESRKNLLFASTAAPAQASQLYKTFDDEQIRPKILGHGCEGIITFQATAAYTPPVPAAEPSSIFETIIPTRPGICSTKLASQYGSSDTLLDVKAWVMGDLSLWPRGLSSSQSVIFKNSSAPDQTVAFYKSFDSTPIVPQIGYNGCVAAVSFFVLGSKAPSHPSRDPAFVRIKLRPVRGIGPTTCTTTFTDQYGSSERPVAVTVTIGRNP